jgi:hypothetical protein
LTKELYDESARGAKPSRLYFPHCGRHNANDAAAAIGVLKKGTGTERQRKTLI